MLCCDAVCGGGAEREQWRLLHSLPGFSHSLHYISITMKQCGSPCPGEHLRLCPLCVTGTQLREKTMAQIKEKIKAPEKIQLSDKLVANLSDAQFKTLVIRMLTELVEYGCKIEEKMKAM